jgi:hypothetical protein
MSQIDDALVKRIRALMAKANGTDNEHEAATFAAKVQELLAKHNLEISVITEEAQDEVGISYLENEWKSPARKALFWAVCKFYMCKGIAPRGNDPWTVVGRKHNVVVAMEMSRYLIKTVIRLSGQYGRARGLKGAAVIDYRRGAFQRLTERLNAMTKEGRDSEAPKWEGGNPGNLPALFASEKALIKRALENSDVKFAPASVKLKQGHHAAHGRAAAETIGLQPQVHGKGNGRLAIAKH